MRENISVENPDYTNILELSLNDIIPERAVLILDSLNQEYFYSKLKSKIELNDKTIDYIDRQLNEISVLLNASVDTLQMYKQRKSIVNLTWEEGDFLGKIGSYDQERSVAQMQIQSLNDLEKYIIDDKDPQFLPPSIFITGKEGFIPKAATELYTKQIELNRLYYLVTDANPGLQEHVNTIKKLKQDLLVNISNERKATTLKIDNINGQIAKYISEAKSIPQKQQDILGFQRKLDVNESIYNFLLEKKANTRIAKASIVPDATIIEAPRNTGEVSPDRMGLQRNFLSAGFAISLIIILLRTLFFTKIKSIEHLKELSDIPAIGVIPFVKKADEEDGAFVDMQPNSLAAEAFRNIRTNLQYASVGYDQKTFLVTSFLPGEGKTFTSVNLATTLAKTGKRTLIMELDLHKPRVYKNLGLPAPSNGITTFITNQGEGVIEDIIKSSVIPNKKTINFVQEIKESNNISNLLFILNGVRNIGKRYYYKGYGYSYGYGYGYGYGKGSSYTK
ncbi:MAG: hypothetical protein IPI93_10360 [Sphingobacteriaceae bacterium]|nr:hypothetical protein [Sphingobacteriaceae bacterium]